MKLIITTLTCVLALAVNASELYKIVHEDGTVTYTDKPTKGAVLVDLEKTNSATMPALVDSKTQQLPAKRVDKALPKYQLTILSPAKEETIRNNLGKVTVTGQLDPVGNGKFELYLDGQLVQTSPAPSFQLQDVVRGEHSIQIKFIHHTGKILASSEPRVFFVHQASVFINPN
ncbi:MAG: hypothetical protein Alis3KO_34260 [Aliiglaciecola sp.]